MKTDFAGYKKAYQKRAESCAAHLALHEFKTAVSAAGAIIEPFDFARGIAVVITTVAKSRIKMVQDAAAAYIEADKRGYPQKQLCDRCVSLYEAIKSGKVKKDLIRTECGVTITVSWDLADAHEMHQLSGCCDYCICPSTVTHCAQCC